MSHPFFSCSVCSAYVQLKWHETERYFLPDVSQRELFKSAQNAMMVTSELESDDFANNCRGQGSRYSDKNKHYLLHGESVNHDDHFNFEGKFKGMCCFCSTRMGFSFELFSEVRCYHCKQRDMLFVEFSRLRVVRKQRDTGSEPSWETHGWGALSDTLIDYILALATNNRIGRDGNVDACLLEC